MEWAEITENSIYTISKDKVVRDLFEKVKKSKRITLSLKPYKETYKDWFGAAPVEKLYNAVFCITEYPKCKCGNQVKFESFRKGYRSFCSGSCAQKSSITRKKMCDTLEKKFGTRDPLEIKKGRERGIFLCNNNEEVQEKENMLVL